MEAAIGCNVSTYKAFKAFAGLKLGQAPEELSIDR
jgi:hypothetical protein